MSDRILGPKGRRRKRRLLLSLALSVAALAAFAITNALAVHDEEFQLDGNVLASVAPAGSTQDFDWDDLFDANGGEKALPTGFTASGFERDFLNTGTTFITSDNSTYATGSKDTLPITPGWQCNHDSNVNSKIDITNAYAAAYTNADDEEILYFALERNTNTGDANVGFWFLQDQVSCDSPGGSEPFVGDHLDGDLLIVSAFTNGGTVSTIDVYRWDRFAGSDCDPANPEPVGNCVINPVGVPGFLRTTPVAHGVDCRNPATGTEDPACAAANTSPITTPWLTAAKTLNPKVGHNLPTAQFFEGGLNLTKKNLGGRCFNTFIGDTRSSQSLTATLFDFSLGTLGECTVSMETEPSQTTRVIGDTTEITDTATVVGNTSGSGTAPTPTGEVTFFLCGPSELTSTDEICEDDAGTQVGDPVTVSESVPGTATAESADASSLIDGIGKYCFRATFEADPDDPNYPGQTALTANPTEECFTVTGTAGLTTAQDWLPNDTATLTGDANLNGTLTFTLFHDGTCGEDDGEVVYGPTEVAVDDAASGDTFSTDNTTTVVEADEGLYSWLVSYDDDVLADPDPTCEVTDIDITDVPPTP